MTNEGGADSSADVSHGFKFTLESPRGDTMDVNVEVANGASVPLTEADAANAVREYLDSGRTPPRRILMDRQGVFRSAAWRLSLQSSGNCRGGIRTFAGMPGKGGSVGRSPRTHEKP